MEYMFLPLKRYADFSGRSSRKEFWMFMLLYMLVLGAFGVFGGVFGAFFGNMEPGARADEIQQAAGRMSGFFLLFSAVILLLIVPIIAVHVRRFHDLDKSGWFILLNFIPYVGGLIVLVFMCLDGTKGENRFGPDPKQRSEDLADVFS